MQSDRAAAEQQASPDRPLARMLALPVGIALCAVAFALAVPFWTSSRGVAGPALVDSERPLAAALATVAAFIFATLVAIGISRVVNAVVGTFVLGCGVGLLSMRTGAAQELAFSGTPLWPMAVETAGWAVLVAGASLALYRFGGRLSDFPRTGEDDVDAPTGSEARRSWIAAILALGFAWAVAATDLKGQSIAAVIMGGFFAAFAARMLAPRTQPVLLAAVIVAVFAVTQAYIAFAVRGDLAGGIIDGTFPRLLRIMPVDAAAGSLCGVALGFGFARSFVGAKEG